MNFCFSVEKDKFICKDKRGGRDKQLYLSNVKLGNFPPPQIDVFPISSLTQLTTHFFQFYLWEVVLLVWNVTLVLLALHALVCNVMYGEKDILRREWVKHGMELHTKFRWNSAVNKNAIVDNTVML